MSEFGRYVPEHRRTGFKNRGQFSVDALRRRREEAQVEIRRNKREENLAKRRNQESLGPSDEDSDDDGATVSYGGSPFGDAQFASELPKYLEDAYSDDPERWLSATTKFRRILSRERNPPLKKVVDSGVVPRLVEFLKVESHWNLQFEAAWALTNIASGSIEETAAVINAGAVPVLVKLLDSPHVQVQEQAVWTLGNIAGDSTECRDMVIEAGALEPMIRLLDSKRLALVRNATWTISNFCRGRNPSPNWDRIQHALPALAKMLYHNDEDVLADATWAISYLSDGANEKIQAVIDCGIPRRLVELLETRNNSLLSPVIRTLGNIVTGNDSQTQVVINAGALPKLLHVLGNRSESIRKEACWTLSNVTAGSSEQIQAVIDNNLIPPLIDIMAHAEFKTKREACWAISNATSGALNNPDQMRYLVSQGCIKPLCDLLNTVDSRVVGVALDGLDNILRVGEYMKDTTNSPVNEYALYIEEAGGVDKINECQTSPNEQIYTRAYNIITKYFSDDDGGVETGLEPQAAGDMFGFGQTQQPQGGFQF